MRKTTAILTLLCALSTGAPAADYDYLVFTKTDGTQQAIPASGLTITFSDGQLVATSGTTTLAIAQSDLSSMAFSDSSSDTAIGAVESTSDRLSLRLIGRQLYVTAPAGTRVTVATLQGMVYYEHTTASASSEAVGASLPQGVYIVKVNERTTKLQVK